MRIPQEFFIVAILGSIPYLASILAIYIGS